MASAPMRYNDDGSVDWGNMWDSFCGLALDGGPPHRGTLLAAPVGEDAASPAYQAVVAELQRGIAEVSGLQARPAEAGWLAVDCPEAGMSGWLCDAINSENVQARFSGHTLFVPVGAGFALKGEIKNVITAVAKTSHYWREHLSPDVKRTLALQSRLAGVTTRLSGWLRRAARPASPPRNAPM
jgi:sirohydrochlorin cobaltochelatase